MNLNELISLLHENRCAVDIWYDRVYVKGKKEMQSSEAHLEDAPLLPELVVASRLSSSSLHSVLIRRTLKKRKRFCGEKGQIAGHLAMLRTPLAISQASRQPIT